ncbi:hypothetical protein D3C76_1807760 [compost metagenome]
MALSGHPSANNRAKVFLLTWRDLKQVDQRVILGSVKRDMHSASEFDSLPGVVGFGFGVKGHEFGAAVTPPRV